MGEKMTDISSIPATLRRLAEAQPAIQKDWADLIGMADAIDAHLTQPAQAVDVLADADKLALALEALELADGVMSYCAGDAWERESTASDRERFDEIYAQLCPRPFVEPPAPIWPTKAWVRSKYGRVACDHCGKILSGEPNAIKQHCSQFHPGMPARSRVALPKDSNGAGGVESMDHHLSENSRGNS